MYRGTTPTITINCDIDASEFVTMWVTFRVQKRSTYGQPQEVEITKRLEDEGVDVDGQVISITLTQADTLLLGSLDPETDQTVEVQIRGKTENTAYRGDRGKVAYEHSQAQHAPADAEKNVQADWNVEDTNSDAYIQNKPTIPKAVTKTVQTMTAATTATYTVSGYIVSVVLIDSVTKEQIMGDLSFDNATASANSKVTVTFSAAPTNPVLVIITSVAL